MRTTDRAVTDRVWSVVLCQGAGNELIDRAPPINNNVIMAAQRVSDLQCYFYQIAINSLKLIDLNLNERAEKTAIFIKENGRLLMMPRRNLFGLAGC
jgi:hypothetical protein